MNLRAESILDLLTKVPVIDTTQAARLTCKDNDSPNKRASELLLQLENQKMIEGRRREIGKTKVWRLTKKGRDQFKITRPPVPLSSGKIDHVLAIGDAYLDLIETGKLLPHRWLYELREPMGKRKYCADAFFVHDGKPYLLEVQRSPISSKRWAEKWAIASEFFDNDHLTKASFQFWKPRIVKPRIMVLSAQEPDTIRAGTRLDLLILNKLSL